MRIGCTLSVCLVGMEGYLVEVEAHVSNGLPAFSLVGLPDASVREARDRIRAAVTSCAVRWPDQRAVINLSPASLPKTGSGYDLAMAMALLGAAGVVDEERIAGTVFLGELGLDGRLHSVNGILPAVFALAKQGLSRVVVPSAAVAEARLVSGIEVIGMSHLAEVINHFGGEARVPAEPAPPAPLSPPELEELPEVGDLNEVRGQDRARLALEVAAAGEHHLLLIGTAGCGKTMLASRLPGILPRLGDAEAIEVTALHSLAGTLTKPGELIRQPPFQAPHHSATIPAIVGGGSGVPRPGAISLAHRGVLFLDEAPEFSMRVLDSLRQPMENGQVVLQRATGAATYPAQFQLVAAANPCPCGNAGSTRKRCTCSSQTRRRYLERLSGPLLDRIDIQIRVEAPTRSQLRSSTPPEDSATVAARVRQARAAAGERWRHQAWSRNRDVPGSFLRGAEGGFTRSMLNSVDRQVDTGLLSLRGADRVLRLAWTVADLRGHASPQTSDLETALELRTQSNGDS